MLINQLKTLESQEGIMERVSPDFPVSVYKMDFTCVPCHTVISWHWHDDFQICWVDCGTVKFRVVEQYFVLEQNTGLFINCRLAHTAEPLTADASYFGINLHPDIICADRKSKIYQQTVLPFVQPDSAYMFSFSQASLEGSILCHMIQKILAFSEEKNLMAKELFIQSEILYAWPTVLQTTVHSTKRSRKSTANKRLKRILYYIQEHYSKKITLQDIAGHIHLCPEECSRFFKKTTGTSLVQYIIQYRIERSKELICFTDFTIAQIAQAVGFSTQSYFTYCFQKYEKQTPNQYRRTAQNSV